MPWYLPAMLTSHCIWQGEIFKYVHSYIRGTQSLKPTPFCASNQALSTRCEQPLYKIYHISSNARQCSHSPSLTSIRLLLQSRMWTPLDSKEITRKVSQFLLVSMSAQAQKNWETEVTEQEVRRTNCACGKCDTLEAWEDIAGGNSYNFATPALVSTRNDVWETTAEIPYWWPVTTQIWVVLLRNLL